MCPEEQPMTGWGERDGEDLDDGASKVTVRKRVAYLRYLQYDALHVIV